MTNPKETVQHIINATPDIRVIRYTSGNVSISNGLFEDPTKYIHLGLGTRRIGSRRITVTFSGFDYSDSKNFRARSLSVEPINGVSIIRSRFKLDDVSLPDLIKMTKDGFMLFDIFTNNLKETYNLRHVDNTNPDDLGWWRIVDYISRSDANQTRNQDMYCYFMMALNNDLKPSPFLLY